MMMRDAGKEKKEKGGWGRKAREGSPQGPQTPPLQEPSSSSFWPSSATPSPSDSILSSSGPPNLPMSLSPFPPPKNEKKIIRKNKKIIIKEKKEKGRRRRRKGF